MHLFFIYQFIFWMLCSLSLPLCPMEQPNFTINCHSEHKPEDLKANAASCTHCKDCIQKLQTIVFNKKCPLCTDLMVNFKSFLLAKEHLLKNHKQEKIYQLISQIYSENSSAESVERFVYDLTFINPHNFSSDDIKTHQKHTFENVHITKKDCILCSACIKKIASLENATQCEDCKKKYPRIAIREKVAHIRRCTTRLIQFYPVHTYLKEKKTNGIADLVKKLIQSDQIDANYNSDGQDTEKEDDYNVSMESEEYSIDKIHTNHTYNMLKNSSHWCSDCLKCVDALEILLEKKCPRCNEKFRNPRNNPDFKKTIFHFINDHESCRKDVFPEYNLIYDEFASNRPTTMTQIQMFLGIETHAEKRLRIKRKSEEAEFPNDESPDNSLVQLSKQETSASLNRCMPFTIEIDYCGPNNACQTNQSVTCSKCGHTSLVNGEPSVFNAQRHFKRCKKNK